MQLLWRHRLPVLLLAAYWVLAMALYLRWERENWYPTTGDEPHHIAICRSVVQHASLELTDYYEAEAVRQGRGESFEMRTYFDDVADLLLGEIVLEPID